MFKEIIPTRLYENVIEQIMDLIKSNELKPGDKLPPERELAEKLSISRGSLREAFRVLESRGLIKSKPGGGRFIREIRKNGHNNTENIILSLKKSSILELLEAREIFEVKIAKIAAQRATVEDIELIEQALNKMNEEEKPRYGKETESDTEFHLAIARVSHNFVFVNIIKLHLDLLKETREKTQQIPGRREKRWHEHQAILQAIKEHDSKKAGEAMLNHLRNIREIVVGM
ncbi:MAG: FadR/GntR family transcriptional regulator [Candidatus Caldatribacteriota bacterium]|nr:FadR/GntR family transcriptional regulator [Candidatus Caldatribacteriota bacterium]